MSFKFSDSSGRKVVAADTADDAGSVKTFIVDATGRRITQVQIAGRSRNPDLVDWESINSFGEDVVMIASASAVHPTPDDRTDEMVRGDIEYIGSLILCTEGDAHGVVSDVHFDASSGEIKAILGDDAGRISADSIKSLGSYAVVVDHAAIS